MTPRIGPSHDVSVLGGQAARGIGQLAPIDALRPAAEDQREIGVDAGAVEQEPHATSDMADRLCEQLGLPWTRHNAVWTSSALTHLRRLQRRFLEAALRLPADRRAPLLRATRLVEEQVQLRLRLEQMAAPLPEPEAPAATPRPGALREASRQP